jgi:hypothetical protein
VLGSSFIRAGEDQRGVAGPVTADFNALTPLKGGARLRGV